MLWHAATLYREYSRADIAGLVAEGLEPLERLVLDAVTGRVPASFLQHNRGWTTEHWTVCPDGLIARRWVAENGSAAEMATQVREAIDDHTNGARWDHGGAYPTTKSKR